MKTTFTVENLLSRFLFTVLTLFAVVSGTIQKGYAQERVYANEVTYSSPNVPGSLSENLGPESGYTKRTVEDPGNALLDDDSYARLQASPGLILGLGAYQGVLELKFATPLAANQWSYVRIGADGNLFDALLGGSLGEALGQALGAVLIGNQEITIDALNGSTSVLARSSTEGFDTDRVRLVVDGAGNYYIAIKPDAVYDRLRITNSTGSLVGLGTEYSLDVYNAFYYEDNTDCLQARFTSFDGEGLSLSLLEGGAGAADLGNAVDDEDTTYSQISAGTLSLGVGNSIYQTIYYDNLSEPQDYLKLKLGIGNGAVLNAELIGNIEIKAFAGDEEVYVKRLSGGLINGIDVLGLLQDGQPATVYLGPGVAFDRVTIGYNALVDLNLGDAPIYLYDIKRYGPNCPDPNPPTVTATPPMLLQKDCASSIISFDHADFPFNAVDGNNDTYTTLEASSGVAAGLGDSYDGHIELGFATPIPADTTVYVRIDFDEEQLGSLMAGSVGELLGDVVDNVLFGSHYFTVEAKNGEDVVFRRSSNNGFNEINGIGDGLVRVVQDKNGHYYIALTSEAGFSSIRVTEHLSSLVGLGTIEHMNVYHACYSTGADPCEQTFATFAESAGLSLDVLDVGGGAGVRDAYLAIDGEGTTAVEDDNTYSTVSIGAAGIGANAFQFVDFHTLSSPADYFKVKIGIDNGSALNAKLLSNIEIRAYNGDSVVYRQQLQNGLVAGLDILGLLSTDNVVTIPIGPGVPFDRVAIGVSALVDGNLFSSPLRVYSIKRFGASCPDPNPLPENPETESPFTTPSCGVTLGAFEHVNFAYNAIDGDHDSYATLAAGSGLALGIGGYDGYIEMAYDAPVPALETSYIRIDMADEGMLDALVGGSLGEFIADVGDLLLFGNHYFDISVRDANGDEIFEDSSLAGFENNNVRIVKDKFGRFYIAFTAAEPYQSVRITLHNTAAAGLEAVTTMNVYGMCRETEFNPCEQATFTSFDGTGLSASLFEGTNPTGVINPQYVIDDNNSNYAEFSLGTAAVGATIYQDIYFKAKSSETDKVKLRLQTPGTLANVDVLGAYKVYLFNGDEQVYEATLQDGLVNDLDLLGLFNSGGVVGIEFEPGVVYDRVRFEVGSVVAANILGPPVRLYNVYRISEACPDPEFEQSPFEVCADTIVGTAEYVDDIQNLVDGNHNSYATIRSDAGLIAGISAYSGHVELGFDAVVPAGTTSYVRIGYDNQVLDALVGGSLGTLLGDIVETGLLGRHYFNVIVRNGENTVVEGRSEDGFDDANGQIRIIQDTEGRYYLAITPDADYQSIRLEDHTTALLGLTSSEGHLDVYSVCHTPIAEDCPTAFSTSFDGSGLTAEVLGTADVGVQNAFWAIDQNTSNYSTLSLGNAAIGATIQQNIQFDKTVEANTPIRIRLAVGDGTALSANLLSTLQVIGYVDGEEVFVEDFDQAFLEANLFDLLNNGDPADLTLGHDQAIDEIAIRLSALAGLGIAPNVRLYSAIPDCNATPQFVAWKSFLVNDDAAVTSVSGGEEVTYTIHVRNTGGIPMTDFQVVDTIPAHTTYVENSGGTLAGQVLTFDEINIPAAADTTVSFKVKVDSNLTNVDSIFNVAVVRQEDGTIEQPTLPPLPDDPNNPDEDSDGPGTIIPVDQVADLVSWKAYEVDGDATIDSVSGGETIDYSIYVRNIGNQDLTNVIISDALPNGTTYVSGGTEADGVVSFTIPSLAVGQTSDAQVFTVKVNDSLEGITVIRNVALAQSDEITNPEESYPPIDNQNPSDPDTTGNTGTDIGVIPSQEVDHEASTLEVTKDNAVANGVDYNEVTATVVDTTGTPVANREVAFSVTLPDGTVQDTTVATDAEGKAVLPIRSTEPGEATVAATVDGLPISGSPATVTFAEDDRVVDHEASTLEVTKDNAVANGVDYNEVTATVVDTAGTPVANREVVFTITRPDGTVQDTTVATDAEGKVVLPIRSTEPGEATIAATVDGLPISGSPATVTFVEDDGLVDHEASNLEVTRDNAVADGVDYNEVTATVVDTAGTPVANREVVFTITRPDGTVQDTTVATDAEGKAVLPIRSTEPGEVTIAATVDGLPISGSPVTITFGELGDLSIDKVADQDSLQVGESASFTLTITNNSSTIISSGKTIHLVELPSEGLVVTGYEVTSGNGSVEGNGNTAIITTTTEIPVNGTIVVKVNADVSDDAPENIHNGIQVWGPDKPTTEDPDDESQTPDVPVNHLTNMSVEKVADQEQVQAGEQTTFTVTITNDGPATVLPGKTIHIAELPGEGLTITNYEVTSGNASVEGATNAAVVTTDREVAAGEQIVLRITAMVSAEAPASITNGIRVWGPDKPTTDDPDDEDQTPDIPVEYQVPEAVDDEAETTSGTPVTIDVLANDGTGDWPVDPSTIAIVNDPQNGTLTINPDGTVAYVSNTGFVGVDRFTYTVKDDHGHISNTATVIVNVAANPLLIPNVFTPNGDGKNDRFEIVGIEGYDRVELYVFNRWGTEVYDNPNYNNNWDGQNLNEGTYYYMIKLIKDDGQVETRKGWVLMKRQ